MPRFPKPLLLAPMPMPMLMLMLMLASCGLSQAKPRTTIPALTPPSSSSSPASSATEVAAPCSMLRHGQVSMKDTSGALLWLLPLLDTIDKVCPAK
jgi:hypothetical protein